MVLYDLRLVMLSLSGINTLFRPSAHTLRQAQGDRLAYDCRLVMLSLSKH